MYKYAYGLNAILKSQHTIIKSRKKTLISNRGVHQHLPLSSTCTTSSPPTNRQNLPHQCHFHKLFWPLQIRWELSSWAVSADLHLHPFPCWCCRENRSSLCSAWEIWWCPSYHLPYNWHVRRTTCFVVAVRSASVPLCFRLLHLISSFCFDFFFTLSDFFNPHFVLQLIYVTIIKIF